MRSPVLTLSPGLGSFTYERQKGGRSRSPDGFSLVSTSQGVLWGGSRDGVCHEAYSPMSHA